MRYAFTLLVSCAALGACSPHAKKEVPMQAPVMALAQTGLVGDTASIGKSDFTVKPEYGVEVYDVSGRVRSFLIYCAGQQGKFLQDDLSAAREQNDQIAQCAQTRSTLPAKDVPENAGRDPLKPQPTFTLEHVAMP